jgi:hypothetical protein
MDHNEPNDGLDAPRPRWSMTWRTPARGVGAGSPLQSVAVLRVYSDDVGIVVAGNGCVVLAPDDPEQAARLAALLGRA